MTSLHNQDLESQLEWVEKGFAKLNPKHENRTLGLEVIRSVRNMDKKSGMPFKGTFEVTPSPVHVFRDIIQAERKGWEVREKERLANDDEVAEMGRNRRGDSRGGGAVGRTGTGVSSKRSSQVIPAETLERAVQDKMDRYIPSGAVKYHDSFSNAREKSVTLWQFRNGWDNLAVNPGADTTDPGMRPYGVFDVEGGAVDGVAQCFHPPLPISQNRQYCARTTEGRRRVTTTMIPAGQLIAPRIEGYGVGNLLVGLFGVSVVLSWEPTDANLRWVDLTPSMKDVDHLRDAIRELAHISVSVLWAGQRAVLPPGTIHATIAVTCSAMTRWELVDMDWFENKTVRRVMNHQLDMLKKRKREGRESAERLKEVADKIEKEIQVWRAGAQGCFGFDSKDKEDRAKVTDMLDLAEIRLSDIMA
jgi:hypothetical protein